MAVRLREWSKFNNTLDLGIKITTDVGNRVLKYDDEILLDVKVKGLINCSDPVTILVFIYIFLCVYGSG